MRRFKTTPQKKFLGMVILFVLVPLFLLTYTLFITKWHPSNDTIIIVAAIAVLFCYLYRKYKKQQQAAAGLEEEPEAAEFEEESEEDAELEEQPEEESGLEEEPDEEDAGFEEEPDEKGPK